MTADVQAHLGDALAQLDGHDYMSLTTYRKSGAAVATPVWFARVDDNLYVMTLRASGKVKRISHTPRVRIAPCDRAGVLLGETRDAVALILNGADRAAADTALAQKYGEQKKMFDARLTDPNDRVYLLVKAV